MAYFDRHDVCAAWNLYLQYTWDGQNDPKYARHCKLRSYFTPSRSEEEIVGLSENALEIYRDLVKPTAPEHPIANSHTSYSNHTLFRMWAGACAPTFVYVWADHFEDAFEEFVEWLDDNAPGHLTTNEEFMELLNEAAQDMHGKTWDELTAECDNVWDEFSDVIERAEADLTSIGHTTLKHGTHIASYEWGGDEVTDSEEYETVLLAGVGEES